jgi:hypothetical protein
LTLSASAYRHGNATAYVFWASDPHHPEDPPGPVMISILPAADGTTPLAPASPADVTAAIDMMTSKPGSRWGTIAADAAIAWAEGDGELDVRAVLGAAFYRHLLAKGLQTFIGAGEVSVALVPQRDPHHDVEGAYLRFEAGGRTVILMCLVANHEHAKITGEPMPVSELLPVAPAPR